MTINAIWKKLRKSPLSPILLPFSAAYYAGVSLIQLLYKKGYLERKAPEIKTLCVGNIGIGGNGKTPLTIYIAKYLSQSQIRNGIVSRGYGGHHFNRPHIITRADSPESVSDETLLYRKHLPPETPIVICPDRTSGISVLSELGVDFCIMDDGLQHLKIIPTKSLCIIDLDELSEYTVAGISSVIPSGILREPLSSGLKRIDRIIFIKRDHFTEEDKTSISQFCNVHSITSFSKISLLPGEIREYKSNKTLDITGSNQVVTLSSIAKPHLFDKNIENLGYHIISSYHFNDHHAFTRDEIRTIREKHPETPLICTEKDIVKLESLDITVSPLYFLSQKITDTSENGETLFEWLNRQIIQRAKQ